MTVEHEVKSKISGINEGEHKLLTVQWTIENNPCAHVRNVFGKNETMCRRLEDRFGFKSLFIISDDGPYIVPEHTAGTGREIAQFNIDAISDFTNHITETHLNWNPEISNSMLPAVHHLKQALKLIYDEIGVGFKFKTNILLARM